jgi:hypothetical protein
MSSHAAIQELNRFRNTRHHRSRWSIPNSDSANSDSEWGYCALIAGPLNARKLLINI